MPLVLTQIIFRTYAIRTSPEGPLLARTVPLKQRGKQLSPGACRVPGPVPVPGVHSPSSQQPSWACPRSAEEGGA